MSTSKSDESPNQDLAVDPEVIALLSRTTNKKKHHPLDEPDQRFTLKIALTLLCALVGAIAALYFFRVL